MPSNERIWNLGVMLAVVCILALGAVFLGAQPIKLNNNHIIHGEILTLKGRRVEIQLEGVARTIEVDRDAIDWPVAKTLDEARKNFSQAEFATAADLCRRVLSWAPNQSKAQELLKQSELSAIYGPRPTSRIVRFPLFETPGALFTRPWGSEDTNWTSFGMARGSVTLAEGIELKLVVNEGLCDLGTLASVRANDLQYLDFRKCKPTIAVMNPLKRLRGLRRIWIGESSLDPADITELKNYLPKTDIQTQDQVADASATSSLPVKSSSEPAEEIFSAE